VPPDGDSTPLLGSLMLAPEAAEPNAAELKASAATVATIAPRMSQVARFSFFTGVSPSQVMVVVAVSSDVGVSGGVSRSVTTHPVCHPIRPVT
jgi:hypothetical protein